MKEIWFTVLCCATARVTAGPVVQLSHGGKLSGKEFDYDGTNVSLFLGVPYAKAPIGKLRFKKPEAFPAWTGVKEVVTLTSVCVQSDSITAQGEEFVGSEDCLHLDITVPGKVDSSNKKAVMVWIHGGGYIVGSKTAYLGAPLAVTGDVIIVAINYRLGAFGFLSDKFGTGNFGLWDQRQALLWVKENIGQFGGDPDLVTIFGESAGAASVSAQLMSPHNDGLFKRAIQESGTLYSPWGWYLSQNQLYEHIKSIKLSNNCPLEESVYQCLSEMTAEDVFSSIKSDNILVSYWNPIPDDDFFPSNIEEENLDPANRFDLMVGFNGQEGLTIAAFLLPPGDKVTASFPLEYIRGILAQFICLRAAPLSIELCVEFLIELYGFESIKDDRERAIQLSYLQGEFNFNADSVKQLSEHSAGEKPTYAYYFTEISDILEEAEFFPIPNWLRKSANHFDEVSFVFGAVYAKEFSLIEEYIGDAEIPSTDMAFIKYLNGSLADNNEMTELMMTAWTNFAKSGNPNQPVTLPVGTPTWPQFDTDTNQFMELNSSNIRVITTPEKERLEKMQSTLFSARRLQITADKAPADMDCDDDTDNENKRRPDDDGAAFHTTPSSVLLLITLLCLLPFHHKFLK